MIDDLVDLAVVAATDVAIDKAAKRYRWALILRLCIGSVFVALVVGLIYITFKYS